MTALTADNRTSITRFTVGLSLLFVILRMLTGLSLIQLQQPVLFKTDADFSYWAFKVSGLAQLLVTNKIAAVLFSTVFISSGILLILYTKRVFFAWVYAVCYIIYSMLLNIYACHSMHYMAGFSVILFAFCARKDDQFILTWELMRYYICFIYSMVFLMKLINGAFFDWDSGYVFFQGNITEYLFHNLDSFAASVYRWFLVHPFIVNLGAKIIFLLEAVFVTGFFTRKYDKHLIVAAILIFMSTYFFVDVFFAEFLIAVICPLIGNRFWQRFAKTSS